MKEGKGMTEKWEQRISLGFLAISFLLFAVCGAVIGFLTRIIRSI